MGIIFFPDDTGIRTNEKTLRLIVHTRTTTPDLYIPSGTTLLDHNARPAQISPATYSPAAQRSAVWSRAVRCRALRCGAVSCCAVLCFKHRAVPGIIRVVVYFFSYFFFFYMYLIFHGPLFFPPRKLPPYRRSERNTCNKSTQHS